MDNMDILKMKTLLIRFFLPLYILMTELDTGQGQPDLAQLQFYDNGRITMDPAQFTKETFECQRHCGDGYFQCFTSCEDSNTIAEPTKAFFQAQATHHKPKWGSYLLKLLTFGFLGSSDMHIDEKDKIYYEMPYVGGESGMNDNACLKNCTKLFRTCYRHCACKNRADETKCMSELVASKTPPRVDATIPRVDGRVEPNSFSARFDYVGTKQDKEYKFNWQGLS